MVFGSVVMILKKYILVEGRRKWSVAFQNRVENNQRCVIYSVEIIT